MYQIKAISFQNNDKTWFNDACTNQPQAQGSSSLIWGTGQQFLHKWWYTLKSAVFGPSSSLHPLVGRGGGLAYEPVGKADLLSDHFDSMQSKDSVDLQLICHQCCSLITFSFRSS